MRLSVLEKKYKRVSGFTLIELVLVVALLTIAVGISSDIIISLVRSYNKTQVINELEQSANFVLLKLERELRNATSVTDITASSITFTDRSGGVIIYTLNGDVVERQVGGAPSTLPLTNNTFEGGGVSVSCPSGCFTLLSSNPQVVRINMTFSYTGRGDATFEGDVTLDTTIVVRGSY